MCILLISCSLFLCRDQLYLLNSDLSLSSQLSWSPSQAAIDNCTAAVANDNPVCGTTLFLLYTPSFMLPPTQSYACHNHIRVYQKFPGQDLLFVCGSNAAGDPLCRTVELQDGELGTAYTATTASDGLVSYFPEFSGFGEFRNGK